MELNEIKKALYRQKPKAFRNGNTKGGNLLYITLIDQPNDDINRLELRFSVPVIEAENFEDKMDAKLLIRWLQV